MFTEPVHGCCRGQLIYQGGPNYLSTYLGGLGRQIPRGDNPMEYFLDVVQKFDKSEFGVSPLVQYNFDGTKPTIDEVDAVSGTMSNTMSMLYMSHQSAEQQDRSIVSERPPKILAKSPLGDQSRSFKADDYDDEADIENGNYPPRHSEDDDQDEAYDLSNTQEVPMASNYYKGLLVDLVDRFLSPRPSPVRRSPSSPMYATHTGMAAQPSPGMPRTPARTSVQQSASPMQTTPTGMAAATSPMPRAAPQVRMLQQLSSSPAPTGTPSRMAPGPTIPQRTAVGAV